MTQRKTTCYLIIAIVVVSLVYVSCYYKPPKETKRTFTWVDGMIDYQMAYSIHEALFTDVVVRRVTAAEMKESVSNLHAAGIRAWQWIPSQDLKPGEPDLSRCPIYNACKEIGGVHNTAIRWDPF